MTRGTDVAEMSDCAAMPVPSTARRVVLDAVMAARLLVFKAVADGAAEDMGERNNGQKPAEGDAKG